MISGKKSSLSLILQFYAFACPSAVVCIWGFGDILFSIVVVMFACRCPVGCRMFMSGVLRLFLSYDSQVLFIYFAFSSLSVSSFIRDVVRIRVPFGCRLRMLFSCVQVPSGCRLRMLFRCCICLSQSFLYSVAFWVLLAQDIMVFYFSVRLRCCLHLGAFRVSLACETLMLHNLFGFRSVVLIQVPFGCRLRMLLSCMQVPSACRRRMIFSGS